MCFSGPFVSYKSFCLSLEFSTGHTFLLPVKEGLEASKSCWIVEVLPSQNGTHTYVYLSPVNWPIGNGFFQTLVLNFKKAGNRNILIRLVSVTFFFLISVVCLCRNSFSQTIIIIRCLGCFKNLAVSNNTENKYPCCGWNTIRLLNSHRCLNPEPCIDTGSKYGVEEVGLLGRSHETVDY